MMLIAWYLSWRKSDTFGSDCSIYVLEIIVHSLYWLQVKAAETLSQMTSFLKAKSESEDEGQGSIETAGTILVEGLSNILGAADVAEKREQNKTTSDDGYQAQNQTNKVNVQCGPANYFVPL